VKVWVVSHAYAASVNHDKLRALTSLPDLELTLLTPTRWRTMFGLLEPPASAPSYRIIRSRVLLDGHAGVCFYRDGWRELRAAKPHILHAEVEGGSLAALQCVAARVAPVVLFTWENLRGPRRLLARTIERVVLRRVAFVLAGNQAARTRVQRLGIPAERVAVLPQFGVDPARYARGDGTAVRARLALSRGAPAPAARPERWEAWVALSRPPTAGGMSRGVPGFPGRPERWGAWGALSRPPIPIIGYVGRLVPEKGVDVLIDAVEPLDVQLLIVGAGPERARLERRVAAWSPGKAVFTGAIAHEAVPDYLAALDALVLPSRSTRVWAEQFGHVLIEAMAAGVPVVGSASAAIPEVVADAGLLFPEGDREALRVRLRTLLADDALRGGLIERGRARVARCYTHEVIAAAQRDVYERVRAHDL
jgi:glycosyltransferase involved in cell wall biosynthesis